MKRVVISDATLCKINGAFTFKEKIEIARQLQKLKVDYIELPEISDIKSDALFLRTVASFLDTSVLSVAASTPESIENAVNAISNHNNSVVRIELPVSAVRMEYDFHKKPQKMLEYIEKVVGEASKKCDVEFAALDATRAEPEFLEKALCAAQNAGAKIISVYDDAGELLPDDFAAFVKNIKEKISIPLFVSCNDINGVASASALLSVKSGNADGIKTSVYGSDVSLGKIASSFRNCGEKYGISSNIRYTEVNRIVGQIEWLINSALENKSLVSSAISDGEEILLDKNDDESTVKQAAGKLGYDLSDEDIIHVYEAFKRVAEKKAVGSKELDAIIISTALQVPPTYTVDSYIVNSGNSISSSAQVTINKNGDEMRGISIGDGPIDAAFLAIEQIIGRHFELDDFQIQTVTEGKDSVGSAIVKLRNGGKIYSGNGVSTDIIEASIRAYINALNKIVYEEV